MDDPKSSSHSFKKLPRKASGLKYTTGVELDESIGREQLIAELEAQNEEIRNTERRLRELHKKYLKLYHSAPVGYFIFDTKFVIKEVNVPGAKLLGKNKSRLVGMPFLPFIDKAHHKLFLNYIHNFLTTGKDATCEVGLKRKDGTILYVMIDSAPVFNKYDEIYQVYSVVTNVTERRQLQIKKQTKLIQTSIENTMDPFAVLSCVRDQFGTITNFNFEYINEAGCKALRRSKKEIIGHKILEISPEIINSGIFECICDVVETGVACEKEATEYEVINGVRLLRGVFENRIHKIKDGAMITWRNITEKKKVQEKLTYHAMLLENVNDSIVSFDNNNIITTWNRAAERIYGWSEKEVVGKAVNEVFYGSITPKQWYALLDTAEEKGYMQLELESNTKYGRSILVEAYVISVRDNEGNKSGICVVSRDITAKKQTEFQLKKQNERLRVLAEISVAFTGVTVDLSNSLDFASKRIADMTGDGSVILLLSEDAQELSILSYFHPDEKRMHLMDELFSKEICHIPGSLFEDVLNSGHALLLSKVERRDYSRIIKEEYSDYFEAFGLSGLMILPLQVQNRSIGLICLLRTVPDRQFEEADQAFFQQVANKIALAVSSTVLFREKLKEIEERKIAEEALKVQEENQRLLLKELELSNKELERSNRELEQFAYVASHDLQEPLRMISSYTTMLLRRNKDRLDPGAEEYISFITDGAKRMHLLISDLLRYSRVTTKAKAFEHSDCNEIMQEVLIDLKMAIEESEAEVKFESLPSLEIEPVQFRQLFQNLIGNAIKFRGERKPLVNITAQKQEENWLFCVEDNGIGMESQYFDRIFMLFQRLHEREKYPGTGLGLAICKKIVERHGGKIWVESEVDLGSKFFFTVPEKRNNH